MLSITKSLSSGVGVSPEGVEGADVVEDVGGVVHEHQHPLVYGLEVRVYGSGFRVQGVGIRFRGLESRVQGAGFRVSGSGFSITTKKLSRHSIYSSRICRAGVPHS